MSQDRTFLLDDDGVMRVIPSRGSSVHHCAVGSCGGLGSVEEGLKMKRASLFVAVAAILLVAFPLLATPISMGPQAMEGNLKLSPGDLLMAGYDFTIPGSHPAIQVQFINPMVTFQAECVEGGGGGTIVVPMPSDQFTVPEKSSAWFPSGDQHSPLVYQGSVVVPDLCGGGKITLRFI